MNTFQEVPVARRNRILQCIGDCRLSFVQAKQVIFHYQQLNNEKDDISKLEHVQLVLSVSYRRRGDMVIDLVSPQGTTSRLLAKRPFDNSDDGLAKWPFTSMEFWDEKPQGEWTVTIRDEKVMYSLQARLFT